MGLFDKKPFEPPVTITGRPVSVSQKYRSYASYGDISIILLVNGEYIIASVEGFFFGKTEVQALVEGAIREGQKIKLTGRFNKNSSQFFWFKEIEALGFKMKA